MTATVTPSDMALAEQIVNSAPVIGMYTACEWDELSENGQAWIAAIVREAHGTGWFEAKARAVELAEQLGGDRVSPSERDDWRDREGRTGMIINAQRVRAATIATAIRGMSQ